MTEARDSSSRTSPPLTLSAPVSRLSGIGQKRAEALARLGIVTLYDLAWHVPARYVDRRDLRTIGSLQGALGTDVTLKVQVKTVRSVETRRRRVTLIEVVFADESGEISATFFNPRVDLVLQPGRWVLLEGTIDFQRKLLIARPEFEVLPGADARIDPLAPVYPATEDLPPRRIRELMRQALPQVLPLFELEGATAEDLDGVPARLRHAHGLPSLFDALATIHRPADLDAVAVARRRLSFAECYLLESALCLRRVEQEGATPAGDRPLIEVPAKAHERALARLPFELTGDQSAAIDAVRADLDRPGHRMRRLLMGDVGTGKTAVAFYAMLAAIAAGRQSALLAPTGVLASQHAATFNAWLSGSRVRMALLTGALPAAERKNTLDAIAAGRVDLVIGTHALLGEHVRFAALGLAVIDEQHKFGVVQREALAMRSEDAAAGDGGGASPVPHLLAMTATPIPRTLSLALYGDLDITRLRERPRGQEPVETHWVTGKKVDRALADVRARLSRGERGYAISAAVEDNPDLELTGVETLAKRLGKAMGEGIAIAIIHGKLPADEKERALSRFASGDVQLLIATTVVEVGVDVPEATVMWVEHAERFGLAQLHQLRGRINRHGAGGVCYLTGEASTPEAKARIQTLVDLTDGFAIAERDLAQRGPGEFFGARQHGIPRLRVTDLTSESAADLLQAARTAAKEATANAATIHGTLQEAIARHFGDTFPLGTAHH